MGRKFLSSYKSGFTPDTTQAFQLKTPSLQAQNTEESPPQEININQYREFQSCACSLAIAHHHLFSLLMHTGAKNCKTSKSGLQATTHLKATALVISEDLWKGHLSLWLLRYKKTLVSLKMRKYPGFYHQNFPFQGQKFFQTPPGITF